MSILLCYYVTFCQDQGDIGVYIDAAPRLLVQVGHNAVHLELVYLSSGHQSVMLLLHILHILLRPLS